MEVRRTSTAIEISMIIPNFLFFNGIKTFLFFRQGFRFVTYICEGSKLLPHLLQQFIANKGVVISKRLQSLDEIASDYDVIINCTGLGAKQLVNDQSMHPIRGHIFRVKF